MRQQTQDAEFSEYVVAQRVRLVRTARLLTAGDHAAAEDLVQTTLTRLYVHWSRVSRADDPVAYGFRALTNCFLDERHRDRVRGGRCLQGQRRLAHRAPVRMIDPLPQAGEDKRVCCAD